jgi:hypothetical protein
MTSLPKRGRSARNAAGSEARLVHYDLANRYGLKATSAQARAMDDLADVLPPAIYSNRLRPASREIDRA